MFLYSGRKQACICCCHSASPTLDDIPCPHQEAVVLARVGGIEWIATEAIAGVPAAEVLRSGTQVLDHLCV